MTLRRRERGRPGGEPQAASSLCEDTSILPLEGFALADLDAEAARVSGTFVVVVERTGPGSGYRRRPYLTAKAAETAARRAVERGENATVYLAELRPLWRVVGGTR